MSTTINLKYDFNKTYYYNKMIQKPLMVKCLYCENGMFKRKVDGKEVICPVCRGKGEIDSGSGSIIEEPTKCFLSRTTIKLTPTTEDIQYYFEDENKENVYSTVYNDIDKCIMEKSKGVMGYTP